MAKCYGLFQASRSRFLRANVQALGRADSKRSLLAEHYETVVCPLLSRGAKATIPPREGAVLWGNDYPRDAILAEIAAKGREGWKEESGYHRRSIAENMMFRLKQLGDRLFSRTFARQVTEAHVRVAILNHFTYLGMPQSARAGQIVPAA